MKKQARVCDDCYKDLRLGRKPRSEAKDQGTSRSERKSSGVALPPSSRSDCNAAAPANLRASTAVTTETADFVEWKTADGVPWAITI